MNLFKTSYTKVVEICRVQRFHLFFFKIVLIFLVKFSEVIRETFAMISAVNFIISTLVLQKWHSFKHKRRFSQVNMHRNNEIKTILHTHKF